LSTEALAKVDSKKIRLREGYGGRRNLEKLQETAEMKTRKTWKK